MHAHKEGRQRTLWPLRSLLLRLRPCLGLLFRPCFFLSLSKGFSCCSIFLPLNVESTMFAKWIFWRLIAAMVKSAGSLKTMLWIKGSLKDICDSANIFFFEIGNVSSFQLYQESHSWFLHLCLFSIFSLVLCPGSRRRFFERLKTIKRKFQYTQWEFKIICCRAARVVSR